MSSAEYSCKLFKPISAYRQTVWTLIRLLLEEQSDLGPHRLQKWLLKSQADDKGDNNCCDLQFKGYRKECAPWGAEDDLMFYISFNIILVMLNLWREWSWKSLWSVEIFLTILHSQLSLWYLSKGIHLQGGPLCPGHTCFPSASESWLLLTLVLLNPDIPCLCKQCRSRSVGFWRSQLIWTCTVCH